MARVDEIVDAIGSVLADAERPVVLHEPEFDAATAAFVLECVETGWVSSAGKFVDRFEVELAKLSGARQAVATVNGTAALHMALMLGGVRPDEEVLIPALSFVATANAVTYCGAIPHFVDSEETTLGVGAAALAKHLEAIAQVGDEGPINRETGRRIAAIVPMHTFGHPVDLDGIEAVCRRYGLTLIEDAAESLGSYHKGAHTGTRGRLSALSFNGNKVVTTGGGGAVLTNDDELGARAKHLTTTAKIPHRWEYRHDEVGYNYRMPNINAALGCGQLMALPRFIAAKRRLAQRYMDAFDGVEGARVVGEPEGTRSNYWLIAILLDEEHAALRDPILERTNGDGIMTRPAWTLLSKLPMFAASPAAQLPVATSLEARLINVPSSPKLAPADA